MSTVFKKNHFTLRRGDFYVDSQGYLRDIGYVKGVNLELSVETLELRGGNDGTVVASRVVSRNGTLSLTLQSTNAENTAMGLHSIIATLSAETAKAVTLPALKAGAAFRLAPNVTEATVGDLVEGVDYELKKAPGLLIAIKDIAADTEVVFSSSGATAVGIMSKEGDTYRVVIDASKEAGEVWTLYRWKPSPAASTTLNDEGGAYAEYALTGSLLADENAPDVGELGNLGRIEYVGITEE